MIGVARTTPYRPCDWHCGRSASFEVSGGEIAARARLHVCEVHLTPSVMAMVRYEDSGTTPYPQPENLQ